MKYNASKKALALLAACALVVCTLAIADAIYTDTEGVGWGFMQTGDSRQGYNFDKNGSYIWVHGTGIVYKDVYTSGNINQPVKIAKTFKMYGDAINTTLATRGLVPYDYSGVILTASWANQTATIYIEGWATGQLVKILFTPTGGTNAFYLFHEQGY